MTASMAAFEHFVRTGKMPQTPITYEAGIDEPAHPDFSIAMRMEEVAISDCKFGCKIYADPSSRLRVLVHNRVYGCTVTREGVISHEQQQPSRTSDAAGLDHRGDARRALAAAGDHLAPPRLI